jgi:MYXO-CTERM domain-containing protein
VAVTDSGTGDPRTGAPVTTELTVPIVVADSACGCASGPQSAAWTLVAAGLLTLRRRR